ncbi:hypothetical protein CASFOL_012010 [Castilleja foliolosa]|uniref:Uncharacterized protein n=1 Tax=Castilleja foliolosa TaxID=1961234 RepID=A0ABD3DCZ5_9LAMI
MSSENEPAKLLLPYLQRADELQKHEPLVAYYCRLYAMERGLKIPQKERTKMTNSLLISLINQLEKDKKSLVLAPDDHLHVEGFASNVFSKADKQDRAGRADLNTAKTFYAASIFFEILSQFGEVQPDLEQKQKYAIWKAADIRKALKEGKKPVPGPPDGDKDLSATSSGEYDPELSRSDSSIRLDPAQPYPSTPVTPGSDLSHQPYDRLNSQHPTNISPQPSNITYSQSSDISSSPHYPTADNYPTTDNYPTDNFHQPSLPDAPEHSIHPQSSYHQQPYQQYPSQNITPQSYPNFQSYPSFSETTLPTAPSHYPSSYYQGSDASSFSNLPPGPANYPSGGHYDSVARNGNVPEASPPAVSTPEYEYDSSYQPSPEQIAEAHKAARFAVGALAFDDVSIAVEHLRKSLELLTKPSSGH